MRKVFCDLIARDSEFVVAATAANGSEAVEAVRLHKPDVITMDLEMPEMNGLEAMKQIMRSCPTPVIMVSAVSDDGARDTINALQSGAFDFIRKPAGASSPDIETVGEQLLEKMRIAVLTRRTVVLRQTDPAKTDDSRSVLERPGKAAGGRRPKPSGKGGRRAGGTDNLPDGRIGAAGDGPSAMRGSIARPAGIIAHNPAGEQDRESSAPVGLAPAGDAAADPPRRSGKAKPSGTFRDLILIGTSTGGPRALLEVMSSLPGHLPAPVLIVQHMPPKFTRSLAQRLDAFSELTVVEAADGQRVHAGVAYLAPGGYHMKLAKDERGYFIQLTLDPPVGGHRPSVDVLFESCVPYAELRRHSVIMTGMGSDGVKGMKALNDSGGASAIAEAEETCVVYGMPRAAVEAGAAFRIVPLPRIASALAGAITS